MLTTKYTYAYRALGALGCGLVLLGIFLPWAAVTDGRIGPFPSGTAPSGWDLAYKQQMSGSNLNIGGIIFAAVFGMVIFAILGLIAMAVGQNGVSFGYFLISSSVFFLLFMLAILPYAQQAIPVPEDPFTPEKQAELDNLTARDPAEGSRKLSEMMKLKQDRDTVLQWKNLKMVPQAGFVLSFAGSVMAYVLARLILSDNAKLDSWRKYQSILGQVHADGKVTTDEAAILARERQILKISKEDHEYIIRRTVADPGMQQRLLAMHEAPIDVERVLRAREFETYKRSLVQAHADGKVTQDESELLRTQREGLGITDADHEAMMNELIQTGQIIVSGPVPRPSPTPIVPPAAPPPIGPAPAAPPSGPAPAAPPTVPAMAAPPSGPAPAPPKAGAAAPAFPSAPSAPSTTPPAPPAPAGTPLPPRPALYAQPSPGQKPLAEPDPLTPVSLLSSVPPGSPDLPPVPPPEGAPKEPLKLVKCTKCGETIPVFTEDRPLELSCPKCGFKGTLRK